ncbi:MAG: hypothetical protein GY944_08445 [bacterium]|nr:hypothetical protein [bacterium]
MGERIASATILVFVFMWIVCAAAVADAADRKHGSSDLEGTWFVLIHYRDSNTANADKDRWLDKAWTFEIRGSRLHWVEYPIVVFQSSAGRFESYKGNPRSRVLAKWEPNASQLKELMGGPRVNSRGSKSKSLRGSDARGWKSTGRNRVSGANVVGYHEDWSIGPVGEQRSFVMHEVMGNAARGSAEGETSYIIDSAAADGSEFSGRFDRDGSRIGTFRMFRTPGVRPLVSSEEEDSVNKRLMRENAERFIRITE